MKKTILISYLIFTITLTVFISNSVIMVKTGGKRIHYFSEEKSYLDYTWAKENIGGYNPEFEYYSLVKTNTEIEPRFLKMPILNTDTVATQYMHDIPTQKQ